jgi:hypothetical protein
MRRLLALTTLPVVVLAAACNNDQTVNSATGVAACATAIACNIVDAVSTHGISGCTAQALSTNDVVVAAASHFSTEIVNCIAAAGSNCDAAKKCLGGGETPAACTGSSSSCSGAVLSFCSQAAGSGGNMGVQKFNCGDVAEMCVVNNNAAECGVGSCAAGGGMCVGTKVQSCNNGILQQYDCASYGDTCVSGALNIPHCRGTGPSCQTQGLGFLGNALRCDGNVLVRCADSQEARFDCAVQNRLCVANVNGEAFGCAHGSSCNPSTYSATCAGAVLSYCNDGVIGTYDCAAAGFKGCSPNNGGTCTQ